MFTGLVEEVGQVSRIQNGLKSCQLTIKCQRVLEGLKLGDSIASNGVCLTVVSFDKGSFTADVMPATLRVSSLGSLQVGDSINLERALRLGDRLGGHMVSGHIDCVGQLKGIQKDDNATRLRIEAPGDFMKYMVLKGSITIEGVSLTVTSLDETSFEVSIIPMTKDETTLLSKDTGALLNLEGDLIAKYVERLVQFRACGQEVLPSLSQEEKARQYESSLNFLKENGFA